MARLNDAQLQWCADHREETRDLLRALSKIPAPSHHEEKRAAKGICRPALRCFFLLYEIPPAFREEPYFCTEVRID